MGAAAGDLTPGYRRCNSDDICCHSDFSTNEGLGYPLTGRRVGAAAGDRVEVVETRSR